MTSTELTEHRAAGVLVLDAEQVDWTPRQIAAFDQIQIAEAPDADRQVFLHVAQRTGLDPFARQIYLIGRYDKKLGRKKWTIQTGIDGFRVVAERNPQYAGQTEPEWCDQNGVWSPVWLHKGKAPAAARVGVYRHDWARPVYATVMFHEFVVDSPLWSTSYGKPAHMIAKVAEAHALRKAFPQDLSNVYSDDEMARADADRPRYDHTPPTGGVSTAELAGAAPAAVEAPAAAAGDDAQAPVEGGGSGEQAQQQQRRRSGNQMGKLFALIREAEIGDRNAWAGQILGREITSFGQLSADDQATLIENLQTALGDGDVVDGELVDTDE